VLRAPADGAAEWRHEIGDVVAGGTVLGTVGDVEIAAPFDGVVRGLVAPGTEMAAGSKVGDVDPRADPSTCNEISDKALAVGGGVVEAVLTWLGNRG
jgi:xanthine dehydrogenase accessory factor